MARRARRSRLENERWDHMVAVLRLMNFAFNNVRLYPPTHTEVVGVLDKLMEALGPILEEQEDVGYGFMDELLYIEGSMSLEETANNQMLVDRFAKCRVKYLTIMRGASREDLLDFFTILNAESSKPGTVPPGEQLAAKGIKTLHIVEAEVDDAASKNKLGRRKTLLDWYVKAVETLGAVQEQFRAGEEADLKPAYRLVDDMTATIRGKGYGPYLLLGALAPQLDAHLKHAVNVSVLCCALAQRHGLNSGQINALCAAALLHDLGRLTIPPDWTKDHTPLNVAEREMVRQHSDWGFLLLARHPAVLPQSALLAAKHHDAPAPKAGGAYFADAAHRILRLADAFDLALAGDRHYWKKRRADRVLRLLIARAEPGDPLPKLLAGVVGLHPPGGLVRLSDGRKALVVRPNPRSAGRPKVFLFEESAPPLPPAADGTPVDPPPVIADLDELDAGGLDFKLSIDRPLDAAEADVAAWLDAKKEYLLAHSL